MSKLFDRFLGSLYTPKRLNEDVWFKRYQPLLLWMCEHPDGRKLLRLDQTDIGEIHAIAKNYVSHDEYVVDGGELRCVTTRDFRVGAKWGNLVRFQWEWFCELAAEYNYELASVGLRNPFSIGFQPGLAYLTLTAYPDPNVETTSCDGFTWRNVAAESFATIRSSAGNYAADSDANANTMYIQTPDGRANWVILGRGITLFDTSSLGASATVSAATLGMCSDSKVGDITGSEMTITSATTASNTALANGDYQDTYTNGTTDFASARIAYASWVSDSATYNTFTLNASGYGAVSKTGISKYAWRYGWDFDGNTTGSGGSGSIATTYHGILADTSGTSTDPKLVVTYTAAAGPANLKTVNGLAKASVKTINGLAIASVKTFNGLT